MKYKLLIIILSGILIWTFFRKQKNSTDTQEEIFTVKSNGILECIKASVDIGKIPKDTILEKNFYLKNTGSEAVKIQEFSVSCDCTQASISDSLVMPGDTTIFKMILNTKDKYNGVHETNGVIKTNGKRTYYRLRLKYDVQ